MRFRNGKRGCRTRSAWRAVRYGETARAIARNFSFWRRIWYWFFPSRKPAAEIEMVPFLGKNSFGRIVPGIVTRGK